MEIALVTNNATVQVTETVVNVEIVPVDVKVDLGASGLPGPAGADGADGAPGDDGTDGLSAYQVAVNNGFVGSEAAWLTSLQGADGAQGPAGPKGDDGDTGPQGPAGADGAAGAPGPGVPVGGVEGDMYVKNSATNYDGGWSSILTKAASTAFAVRRAAGITPLFRVDTSNASETNGMTIAGTGGTITVRAEGPDSNVGIDIRAKGFGACIMGGGYFSIYAGGGSVYDGTETAHTWRPLGRSYTNNTAFTRTGLAGIGIAASEILMCRDNFSQAVRHNTGNYALQRDTYKTASEQYAVAASVVDDLVGDQWEATPIAGAFMSFIRATGLWLKGRAIGSGTNSYQLRLEANTGATNNYAARIDGAVDLNGAGAGAAGEVPTSQGPNLPLIWTAPSGGGISEADVIALAVAL